MKKIIFFLFFVALLLPQIASAIPLNLDYPSFGGFDINEDQGLAQIVAWFYALLVGLSGLAAFIMIVWGGIQWMTSSGDPTRTSEAKDRIQKALLGLLLVLASFLILQTINPEFNTLRVPSSTGSQAPGSSSINSQSGQDEVFEADLTLFIGTQLTGPAEIECESSLGVHDDICTIDLDDLIDRTFSWSSTSSATCKGSGMLANIILAGSGHAGVTLLDESFSEVVAAGGPGTYSYTLECTNGAGTFFDTVTFTITR